VAFPPGSLKISDYSSVVNYTVTVISNPTENFNIYFTVVPSNYEALQYTTVSDAQEYLLTPGSEKKISILLTMTSPPRSYNAFYKIVARKASSGNDGGMVGALVAPAFNVQVDYNGTQPTALPTLTPMPTLVPSVTPISTPLVRIPTATTTPIPTPSFPPPSETPWLP
jgi:hypothetical protein